MQLVQTGVSTCPLRRQCVRSRTTNSFSGSDVIHSSRRHEASLIALLAELDARRVYARCAAPSLFAYCTDVLQFSEPEACLRITIARLSRQHSVVLELLADGRIHLSGLALLAGHLTTENRDELLARAIHRSKRQIEAIVAELAPRPDAPDRTRRLPDARKVAARIAPVQSIPHAFDHIDTMVVERESRFGTTPTQDATLTRRSVHFPQ